MEDGEFSRKKDDGQARSTTASQQGIRERDGRRSRERASEKCSGVQTPALAGGWED